MTPKEKAKELFYKYWEIQEPSNKIAKKYAIIAVDELINAFSQLSIEESGRVHIDFGHGFWIEVKNEIELL